MTAAPMTRRPTLLQGARLRTLLVVAVVAVAIVGIVLVMDRPADDGVTSVTLKGDVAAAAPAVGAIPPDFTVTTTDGTQVSLASLAGQPVWLTFGASWCADCRAEATDLESVYQAWAPKGLTMLQVSIDESSDAVRDYAKRAGLTFPMAADADDLVAGQYRILGIPSHFFIARDGTVQEMRIGGLPKDQMERSVQAIVES